MSKFSIKLKDLFVIGLIIFIACLIASVVIANYLIDNALSMARSETMSFLDLDLSLKKNVYLFTNKLVIKDIVVTERGSKDELLHMPELVFKIDIFESIKSRTPFITNIEINKADLLKFDNISKFMKRYEKIKYIIEKIPKGNMVIDFKEFVFPLIKKGGTRASLMSDFKLDIRGNSLISNGFLQVAVAGSNTMKRSGEKVLKYGPVRFSMNMLFANSSIPSIQVSLLNNNLNSLLWGSLLSNELSYKGYMLMGNAAEDSINSSGSVKKGIYILDIESSIIFLHDMIKINKMEFALNNFPVNISGNVYIDEKITVDLNSEIKIVDKKYGKQIDLGSIRSNTMAEFGKNGFEGSSDHEILFEKRSNYPFEKAVIKVEDVVAIFSDAPFLNAIIKNINIVYNLKDYDKNGAVAINDLAGSFYLGENNAIIKFNSPFYEGKFEGAFSLKKESDDRGWDNYIQFKKVDLSKLNIDINNYFKINGILDGIISMDADKDYQMSGNLRIADGLINEMNATKEIADYFDLDVLRRFYFDSIDIIYMSNKRDLNIRDLKVDSKDIKINGNLSVKERRISNGLVSIIIPRKFLEESSKFDQLIEGVDENIDMVDFEFKLTGNIDSVNFKWIQSDIKNKVQDEIPRPVKRVIEMKLNEAKRNK